jgi:hypothetical protein
LGGLGHGGDGGEACNCRERQCNSK